MPCLSRTFERAAKRSETKVDEQTHLELRWQDSQIIDLGVTSFFNTVGLFSTS